MIYVLDTNTCIACLRRPAGIVARRLATVAPGDIALTTVSITELYRGAYLSTKVADNLAHVAAFVVPFTTLPLDRHAGETAGRIDADLARQGLRIGPYDTLIAAIALAHDLTLVTHNTGEFCRVVGLQLVDWDNT
ncbi:type II toxin-antitoxin system VapC family toxin [Oscillochloris sp. ZM17-4]|uniref:type II toxin-antitoxin system VapC family toxin n=1 Tax=Oscillochloris sp. ZM17-4 TaxID=2866714 RepID=UPI001C7386E7|nr:type II toxin-antitoxin system VapC family toxin [Oscillochloris sp. ZM17-4]MBX0330006.1 type II toxin-antitoxin system VapC family toxin [Oscillochloris sp. ZM17-4]